MARVLSTSEGTHEGAFSTYDWVTFLTIAAIWGSSFILILIGLESFRPGLVTFLRVAAGATTLWLMPASRAKIEREDLPRLMFLATVWVGIPFTLFPLAEQHVNSAVAGMLNGGTPVLAALFASLMLRRLPSRGQMLGLVLGSGGVGAIAISAAGTGSSAAIGVIMLLVAITCYGVAIDIAGPLQQRYGSLPVMGRMLLISTALTAPFGLASIPGSSFSWASAAAVALLGAAGTGIAFVLMGRLVGRVGGTRASFCIYLIPVVALILGVAFRSEHVALIGIVGIAMVIAGASLASRADAKG